MTDTLVVRLRERTAPFHARVDDAFSRFNLADVESYRAFLTAHAMLLPAIERWMEGDRLVPGWRGRTDALSRDLAFFGNTLPPFAMPLWPDDDAARWGALYVTEGSRLGGSVLRRRVTPGFPLRYLSQTIDGRDWRAFLGALDEAGQVGGPQWEARCIAMAEQIFALFEAAAWNEQAIAA